MVDRSVDNAPQRFSYDNYASTFMTVSTLMCRNALAFFPLRNDPLDLQKAGFCCSLMEVIGLNPDRFLLEACTFWSTVHYPQIFPMYIVRVTRPVMIQT